MLPDEVVLLEYPTAPGPLLEQLGRLSQLEQARRKADMKFSDLGFTDGRNSGVRKPASEIAEVAIGEAEASESETRPLTAEKSPAPAQPAATPQPASIDHLGTLDLPVMDDSETPTPLPENTPAAEVQTELPRTANPQSLAARAASKTAQRSDPPAVEVDSAPMPNRVDQLRITLKEPCGDVRNQSTMILDEASSSLPPAENKVPLYRPSVRPPMAVLRLYHDGVKDFTSYPVMSERFRIGRNDGDLQVPHDFWMSGRHAEIQRRKGGDAYQWFLVDLKSTNGTFVQVDFAVLRPNDELFLGQERYRFLVQDGIAGLMHVTRGSGEQWWITQSTAIIGSQPPCGLKSFTLDPYIDELHARLKREPDGTWTIRDNRSQNGVWFRVSEVELAGFSEFQLGEQRFGFWTPMEPPAHSEQLRIASKGAASGAPHAP